MAFLGLAASATAQVELVLGPPSGGFGEIEIANDRLYYTRNEGELCSGHQKIWWVPALPGGGGQTPALLDPATSGNACWFPGPVKSSNAYIYACWSSEVYRVYALGNEPTQTLMTGLGGNVQGMAVDDQRIFVASTSDLIRVHPRDGGAQLASLSVTGLEERSITAPGDGFVYYIAAGAIYKWSGSGTTQTQLEFTAATPLHLWVDSQYVYWIGQSGTVQSVNRIPVGGGANLVRSALESNATVSSLIGDTANLFFVTQPPGGGAAEIRRLPHASGVTADVADIQGFIRGGLKQDSVHLYWSDSGGVQRVAKNVTATRPDLRWAVDRLEVIQVIQDGANSVQLVANKPTMVRAFPMASLGPVGQATARLHGFTTGGSPLPGSPLRSTEVFVFDISTAPDRGDINGSFNFILPETWIDGAFTIRLQAVVDPQNIIPESNEFNNSTSFHDFNFRREGRILIDCRRIWAHPELDYTTTAENFKAIKARAASILPIEGIDHRLVPGRMEEWDPTWTDPGREGPYELDGDALCIPTTDACIAEDNWVLGILILEWLGSNAWSAANIFEEFRGSYRMGMIHPDAVWRQGGLALPLTGAMLVKMSGERNAQTQSFFTGLKPFGGKTIAHEFSHNWFYLHAPCKDPGDEFRGGTDGDYPYDPPCQIAADVSGPSRLLAYDWFDRPDRRLKETADMTPYMGYSGRAWMTPYHWNGLLFRRNILRGGPMPVSPRVAVITGLYDPVSREASALRIVSLDRSALETAHLDEMWSTQASNPAGVPIGIELLDASDQPISATMISVSGACCELHVDPRTFVAVVPSTATVRGVRTRNPDGAATGPVLRASAAAPTVSVTAPAAGASFAPTQPITVAWTASDADGDPLTAIIQYSTDSGTTWQALGTVQGQASQTYQPSDLLPGSTAPSGPSSLFRVLVSDGFNSAMATSAIFRAPNRAPAVEIVSPSPGAGFSAASQIRIEASASDPEQLDVSDFTWSRRRNGITTPLGVSTTSSFIIADGLPPGIHTLICLARDASGLTATHEVTITVGEFVLPAADSDGDGFPDDSDLCPDTFSASNTDTDLDGVGNVCDNCPTVADALQTDLDQDGLGDACDPCVIGQVSRLGIDGQIEGGYGPPLAVQNTQTSAGDSTFGALDIATGSELDVLHAFIDCERLYIGLGGNLHVEDTAGAFATVDIFIDSNPSDGQTRLRRQNPDDLLPLSDDGSGNGMAFDAGFAPDYWIGLQSQTSFVGGLESFLVGTHARLRSVGNSSAYTDLGRSALGGDGTFVDGDVNTLGIRATLRNSNVGGVIGGTGLASGAGVTTGLEISIPLAAINNPTCDLKVFAVLRPSSSSQVSNQTLPGIGGGAALGHGRLVDFNSIPGTQFVTLPRAIVGPVAGSLTASTLGDRFTASTVVYAPKPYSVVWRRNGAPIANSARISGADTTVLTIDPARFPDLGTYTAAVTTACGTAISAPVVLNFCAADFNRSGSVSVQDIFDFLAAYFAQDLRADFNGSGAVTVQDIFDFLAVYFVGC